VRRKPKSKPDKRPEQKNEAESPTLSPRRRRLFILICLLLPLILLLAAEGVARLCGLGGYPPAILRIGPAEGATLVTTNRAASASYFSRRRSRPGAMHETSFLTPKPEGTVRVFLAGGSAIKGFPQPPALAVSAFLQAMLGDVWPDRTVEVINLGTTAVASFPVMEMLTEALDYEPDLIVVCTGNNEFFGAYGVASVHSAASSPAALAFQRWYRSLGLIQAIERIGGRPDPRMDKTLMELVVRQAYVGPDDPLRDAAADNLYAHVSTMIARCRQRGIPVIVCTLASNERDLAPIGTAVLSHLHPAKRQALVDTLARGLQNADLLPNTALPSLQRAYELSSDHARVHFGLGRAYSALKKHDLAAKHFQAAIDLDPMPWRAPSRSNEAIRKAAADHGAVLCDVQQAFREASPGGSIGWELMDDHVHPSLRGQWLLARTILKTAAALDWSVPVPDDALQRLDTFEQCASRLGDNIYDRYGVAHTMRVVFDVPFMRASNGPALNRFNTLCQQYEGEMTEGVRNRVRQWRALVHHKGLQRPITGMVGLALIKEGRFREAEQMFRIARKCVPRYSTWNCEYVYRMLACKMSRGESLSPEDQTLAADAIKRGQLILKRSPRHPGQTHRWIGRLHQICGRHAEAIPHLLRARQGLAGMELVATDKALIDAFTHTGDTDRARNLANEGIRTAGAFAEHYRRFLKAIPQE
jgi:tetratricopeptide (TPR) repeat protein